MTKVLLTLLFNEKQIERLRQVSPQFAIAQKSVPEGSDSRDVGALLDGDEEILYCAAPPRDLARALQLKWVQLHFAGINSLIGHPILQSNIRITTLSGVHAVPIGEFSIVLMMALARRVPQLVHLQDRVEWSRDNWHKLL